MSVIYLTILASLALVKSAKVLVVVPLPSISHQVVFRSLTEELINRDHEVTVITTDPAYPQGGSPNNLHEIDLHDLSYTIWLKVVNELAKTDHNNLSKTKLASQWLTEIFTEQLKDKSVQNIIRDKTMKFDLLIVQNVVPATLIFSYIFKAPVIFMSTYGALPGNMKMIGTRTHPLLYPTHYHRKTYNLTIWEKIYLLFNDVSFSNLHENQLLNYDRSLKSLFGTKIPMLNDLKNNVHMLFLNIHPIWIHNQPVPPNVVYTWGIQKKTEKILPQELQSYLDSSKHGVIYMSFGSIFKTSQIPQELLQTFVVVFSRLPYNVLWKWDADELPGKSENIKISKWFPQCDVLRHPKIKLFITHGGLRSTDEAISAGVPLIGIPQFSDQEYNTEKYVYFKIGVKLDYRSLTIEKFGRAIDNILKNYESYKNNIIQLRTLMYDQPTPALERVIWRIEYLLRHGSVQHLRAPAANMSWVQYYEVEILLLLLSVLIALGTILILTLYTCLLGLSRVRKIDLQKLSVMYK